MVVENSFPRLFRTVLADSSQSEDHSLQTVPSTSKDENTEAKKEPVVLDPKELSVHLTPEQALLKNTAKHNPLIQGSIPKETAIATHAALIKGLSPEREKRIRELYDRLDMDNDGTVDIRDLTAALRREMPHIPERLAPKLMARLSGSKDDDKVNFHDFVKYVVEHEQRLETIFQDLDRNRDGYIDVREIKSYCDNLGAPITDTRARDIVEKMDQTGSASINLNEFQEFMLLYPSSDVKDMVDFWRHNLIIEKRLQMQGVQK